MAIPIGGLRPVDGALLYSNGRNYSAQLLDVRTRMLELQQIQTRDSYIARILNYGNIDLEMQAELTTNVLTPKTGATYSLTQGSPLFLETTRADVGKRVAYTGAGNTTTVINFGSNIDDVDEEFFTIGQKVEINGQEREITALTLPTITTQGTMTLSAPLPAIPPPGVEIFVKSREYPNPHINEQYRVTDQFGSFGFDNGRYMVDRDNGLVRYRPRQGIGAGFGANFIWHPEAVVDTPYYFGKRIEVRELPPPAGPPDVPGPGDGIANNEGLGLVDDPIASGSNILTPIAVAPATYNAAALTNFGLAFPDGEYSNITVTAPANVSFEVELNGAKLAIVPAGGTVTIPFFDPDYTNDAQKANDQLDPDVYIQRFIKVGGNHLAIKATQNTAGDAGIRVQGFFNGVNLETGAIAFSAADPKGASNTKAAASVSTRANDWSASKHSVLGIAGKIDFQLKDTIGVEDINDEIQKAQGVLESLSTIIAGTDINQFVSLLSVLR